MYASCARVLRRSIVLSLIRHLQPSHACHKQTCVIQFVKGEVFHLKFKSGEIHKFVQLKFARLQLLLTMRQVQTGPV